MVLHKISLMLALVLLAFPSAGMVQENSADALQMQEARTAVRQRDYAAAANTLSKLSDSGNAEAQYLLATLYRDGRGVPQDKERHFN